MTGNLNENRKSWLSFTAFFILIFISHQYISAEDLNFTASAPQAVENGSQFRIVYSINEQGKDFQIPQLNDFEFVGGPSTSQSSSTSIINGKITSEFNISYTVYFRALKEGSFTIPPATIKVKNKIYKSNALNIEVVKSSTNVNQQHSNISSQKNNEQVTNTDALFMKIFTDKKNVYVGEQIVATVKLFSKYRIDDNDAPKMPTYNGFYKQAIKTESNLKQENINGQVYLTAILERVILFPQQSGKLVIEPASINLVLLQQAQSHFGFPQYKRFKKNVVSNSVAVNVKPLPDNKPADFNGAVGDFTLIGSVNKTTAKTNDALTFKIVLKGKGNINLVEAPKLKLPPDFETYEPKLNTNISNTIGGQSGTKIFEYLAVPRHAGEFDIDPIKLTYFDTKKGQFKTLQTKAFHLVIEKGDDSLTTPVIVGISKEDIKFLGSDIRYIKTKTKLFASNKLFFKSLWFYLSYLIILIITTIIIIVRRKKIKQNKNLWVVKNKKANKLAGKRLRKANSYLKNNQKEEFYEELAQALWGYVSDKLSIAIAELSKEKACELLKERNVSKETIEAFNQIIDECEFARYAPPSETLAMKDQYNKAAKTIGEIEQNIS